MSSTAGSAGWPAPNEPDETTAGSSGDKIEDGIASRSYHEEQSLQLCAVHMCNNLVATLEPHYAPTITEPMIRRALVLQLQRPVFAASDFDAIADELSPSESYFSFNPHKSAFGTGNYDANIVMVALERQGYEVQWVNKRRGVEGVDLRTAFGLIINIESFSGVLGMFKGRHWFGIRNVGGVFWNHDSKLQAPQILGDATTVKSLLTTWFNEPETQVLLVRPLGNGGTRAETDQDDQKDDVSEALASLDLNKKGP